jgi:hypothetical protein
MCMASLFVDSVFCAFIVCEAKFLSNLAAYQMEGRCL